MKYLIEIPPFGSAARNRTSNLINHYYDSYRSDKW